MNVHYLSDRNAKILNSKLYFILVEWKSGYYKWLHEILCFTFFGKYGIQLCHHLEILWPLYESEITVWNFKLSVDDLDEKFSEPINCIRFFQRRTKSFKPLTMIDGDDAILAYTFLVCSLLVESICEFFQVCCQHHHQVWVFV